MGLPSDFSTALQDLKAGHLVRRSGWNGKGVWLAHVQAKDCAVSLGPVPKQVMFSKAFTAHDVSYEMAPWIGMKTADNKFVPWLASQTDILAEDWEIAD